ncbi:MAG TPA: hypothetical protein VFE13_17810 [Caulobacteraceae bacterium]|jgi:hypothetical protein|nr:hypothetical protein [Caulobacteraceae bacterium]
MNEDRKRVLAMLADGKITADEAERLLDAMGRPAPAIGSTPITGHNNPPKYFRVVVDASEPGEAATKVNVRVPMQLLRAGVRLGALIPPRARDEVNAAMAREGIPFDINQLKPENLDDLIEHLAEFTVDVDSGDAKVRVFCE